MKRMKGWWLRRSLRFRLAAWYSLGGVALLAAFSATVYLYVAYTMAAPLDRELRRDLSTVQANLRILPNGDVQWQGKSIPDSAPWPSKNPWFELWDEKRHLVRRFWPFVESRLDQLPVAPAEGRETISVFYVSPDIRLRVLSVPLTTNGAPEGWMIRMMAIHEPTLNALHALLLIIVVALPVVIVLLVLGGYTLTRRWLKPLDIMVQEANRITASDLSRRLTITNPHDELGRLASVFNTTLSRLEDSFVALDQFVADASHEMLTPLTTLRSVGEVGLRRSRTTGEYQEVIGSMLEEALRLQLLAEKLLQLARAEGGAKMTERTKVQLDVLAQNCVDDARVLAEEKEQRIELSTTVCATETDPLLLRQALQNLLDNAIKHSPPQSVIRTFVAETQEGFEISVQDDGPGVSAEHRERLMNRFFRADAARNASGGFGLGLALTKAYMQVLGGSIVYTPRTPKGSTFRLLLPHTRSGAAGASLRH
jgi:heavy metal sensor kinase